MVGRVCSFPIRKYSSIGSTFWSKGKPTNTPTEGRALSRSSSFSAGVHANAHPISPTYVFEDPPEGEASEEHANDDAAEEEEDS